MKLRVFVLSHEIKSAEEAEKHCLGHAECDFSNVFPKRKCDVKGHILKNGIATYLVVFFEKQLLAINPLRQSVSVFQGNEFLAGIDINDLTYLNEDVLIILNVIES